MHWRILVKKKKIGNRKLKFSISSCYNKSMTDWKMENTLSHILAYIVISAFSPSFPSGKPWLQEKSHSLAYLKWAGYFHYHVCFHSAKATKKSQSYFWKPLTHQNTTLLLPHIHAKHWEKAESAALSPVNTLLLFPFSLPAGTELDWGQLSTATKVALEW